MFSPCSPTSHPILRLRQSRSQQGPSFHQWTPVTVKKPFERKRLTLTVEKLNGEVAASAEHRKTDERLKQPRRKQRRMTTTKTNDEVANISRSVPRRSRSKCWTLKTRRRLKRRGQQLSDTKAKTTINQRQQTRFFSTRIPTNGQFYPRDIDQNGPESVNSGL